MVLVVRKRRRRREGGLGPESVKILLLHHSPTPTWGGKRRCWRGGWGGPLGVGWSGGGGVVGWGCARYVVSRDLHMKSGH